MSLDLVLEGARKYERGEITFQEFSEGVAFLTLVEQGVERPTVEQVKQRVSELDVASSFISAIPKPED